VRVSEKLDKYLAELNRKDRRALVKQVQKKGLKQREIWGVFEAIWDSGCSNSMMTLGRYNRYIAAKQKVDPSFQPEHQISNLRFKVWNGAVSPALFCFDDYVCGQSVRWHVIDSSDITVPPLLGWDVIKSSEIVTINNREQTIKLDDVVMYYRDEPGVPIVRLVHKQA
jgi:hypothetical protein